MKENNFFWEFSGVIVRSTQWPHYGRLRPLCCRKLNAQSQREISPCTQPEMSSLHAPYCHDEA